MSELNLVELASAIKEKLDAGLVQDALDLVAESEWDESLPHARIWLMWATALHRAGHSELAEDAFSQLKDESFGNGMLAARNLAAIQFGRQEYDACLETLEIYRVIRPREPRGLRLWADALLQLSRSDEAVSELEEYRNFYPANREVLVFLAKAAFASGDWMKLLCLAGEIERRHGHDQEVACFLVAAFIELGLPDAASRFIPELLEGAGGDAADYMSLAVAGNYFYQLRDYGRAIDCYGLATQCLKEGREEEMNRGFALLAQGRFDLGWKLYSKRKCFFDIFDLPGIPIWQGEDLCEKKVLINWEQGLGDSIQFMRFLPAICALAKEVVFNAQPQILRLLPEKIEGVDEDVARQQVWSADVQIHLTDLPLICGIDSPEKLPSGFPYLRADLAQVAHWHDRLPKGANLKVGLVWAGSPTHQRDYRRSICLHDLSCLAVLPGVSWISLQLGEAAKEMSFLSEEWPILDLSADIKDFSDTAAIIENLDLVISVDTSVAHLAGALNKPVWILLPSAWVDWRWELQDETTPWYPSARLVRQERNQSWRDMAQGNLREKLWRHVKEVVEIDDFVVRAVDRQLSGASESDDWVQHLNDSDIHWAVSLATELANKQGCSVALDALDRRFGCRGEWSNTLTVRRLTAGLTEDDSPIAGAFEEKRLSASNLLVWSDWLANKGKGKQAIDVLRAGIARWPGDHRLLAGMGKYSAHLPGGEAEALKWLERSMALSARDADATLEYAISLMNRNRGAESFKYYAKALRLSPGNPLPWRLLAVQLRRVGAPHVSSYILEALLRRIDSPELHCVLAEGLALQGCDEEAAAHLSAVNLEKANVEVKTQYATALKNLGRMDEFDDLLRTLDTNLPHAVEARHVVGWRKLQQGDFDEGWPLFCAGLARKEMPFPEWQGENLQGKHILVYQDHGFGDLIQFLPLIHELARCASKVTLAVIDGNADFVRYQDLPARIISVSDMEWAVGECDFHVSQMRLPWLLRVDLLHHDHPSPFLQAPVGRLPKWHRRIASDSSFKVGIIWSGNPRYVNDWLRSTELSDWACLAELHGVSWYSFQKDVASNQALGVPELDLINAAADCESWLDTASILQMMDLIISVDSGGAHLAAGLGKPTWILLPPIVTDYRWQDQREDCPWYPSARLFRQGRKEPWAAVLSRVAVALATHLEKDRRN